MPDDYPVNDSDYPDLARERRRLSEIQHRLLVAGLQGADARFFGPRNFTLDPPDVAGAMGLERRGFVRTYRPEKAGFYHSRRPQYVKGSVRTYQLTPKGRALAESLPQLAAPKLEVLIRPDTLPQILVRKDGAPAGSARYCPPMGAVNAGDIGDGLTDEEWAKVAEIVREHMQKGTRHAP